MSKVSQATLIGLGLVGPKVKPKGLSDGQQVNIPVLLAFRQSNTGSIFISIFIASAMNCEIYSEKVALA